MSRMQFTETRKAPAPPTLHSTIAKSAISLPTSNPIGQTYGGLNTIVKQGWASVKEDGIKSWIWYANHLYQHSRISGTEAACTNAFRTKKYLILKEGSLNMMKNEFSASISSQIPLREVSNVQRLEVKGYCFEIVRDMSNSNTSKSYFLSLKNDKELYEWMVR